MTKAKGKTVKPVLAWALLIEGKIATDHCYATKRIAEDQKGYWTRNNFLLTGPIRVEIRPVVKP